MPLGSFSLICRPKAQRVAGLQQRLLSMGFWLPAVDGNFGSTTQQAVWAFQKANGLPRDGKIGHMGIAESVA